MALATGISMASIARRIELDDGKYTLEESTAVSTRAVAIAKGWNDAVAKLAVTDEVTLKIGLRNLRHAIKGKGDDFAKAGLFALRCAVKDVAEIAKLETSAQPTSPDDII